MAIPLDGTVSYEFKEKSDDKTHHITPSYHSITSLKSALAPMTQQICEP
jgi:hypothetical protein